MSESMRAFLQGYLDWAEGGGHHLTPFGNNSGLCANVYAWPEYFRPDLSDDSHDFMKQLLSRELRYMLSRDRLCIDFPFGGEDVYWCEYRSGTAHRNTVRLNWIRDKLK